MRLERGRRRTLLGHQEPDAAGVSLFCKSQPCGRLVVRANDDVLEKVAKAGLDPTSHAGRSLLHVLETYPRNDLFQIEPGLLLRFALAIVSLADRPRVRVLARPDKFGRFVSLIAYLPKDRTDARLQARIGAYLAEQDEHKREQLEPLCFMKRIEHKIQLAWGGPEYGFKLYYDPECREWVSGLFYWADWFKYEQD